MCVKSQMEKEIREAYIFLRTHNTTIPSDTIDFMRNASLEKLNSIFPQENQYCVCSNPKSDLDGKICTICNKPIM